VSMNSNRLLGPY